MVVHVPDDAPSPRLCVIEKRLGEKEYGYNLHAEKARGQFVGLVDNGSPADRGGLKQGDRIFAVNGQSIVGENHKKVVERIKQNPNRCEMLVISEEGAKWYAEHGIPITLDLPNITRHNPDDHTSNPQFVAPPPPPIEPMHGAHDKPMPRICRLIKSSPSDEFGFNLHAERGRGHFIGTVDAGGIGDRAGLRMGQRIVGVNDTLVYPTTPHKEVVALIKRSSLQTTLLVASEEVDKWYKDHNAEYSFAYAEEYGRERTGTYTQGLTPHSIHISDDDEVIISPQHSSIGRHTTEPPEIEYHEHGHLHYSYNNVGGMSNGSTSRESREGYGDTGRDARESYGRSHEVYGGNSTDRRSDRDDMGSLERGHHRFAPPISDTPLHGPPHPIDTSTPIAKTAMTFPRHYQQQANLGLPMHVSAAPIDHHHNQHNQPHAVHARTAKPPSYFANYLPPQISPESAPSLNLNQQASPLSNGSVNMSGYSRSSGSPTENDIYNLSAKDAREFLRSKNRKNRHRGIDMSLDEKYQVVTNM